MSKLSSDDLSTLLYHNAYFGSPTRISPVPPQIGSIPLDGGRVSERGSIDLTLPEQRRALLILLFAPLTRFLVHCPHSLPAGFLGSLLAVARAERGAREGEGYPGRGLGRVSIRLVEDRLPWVPHQAGSILAFDMDVAGSNRNHY